MKLSLLIGPAALFASTAAAQAPLTIEQVLAEARAASRFTTGLPFLYRWLDPSGRLAGRDLRGH